LIDYAGLFPPASLSMSEALRNYDAYRRGEHAWMLGRFVVPAGKLSEVPRDVPVTAIGMADAEVIEVKAGSEEEIERIAEQRGGRTVYVEVADVALLERIAAHGLRAKIRTGGVTADVFPTAEAIANFIRACAEHGVAFKATAGLHHPIRCVKPLTYEANAPRGTMHGFVNVFLAAALLRQAVIPSEVAGPGREGRADRASRPPSPSTSLATTLLLDDDPRSFAFDDAAGSWRGHRVATDTLADVRRNFAIAFGSCSFAEPVADLQELEWL